MRQTHAGDELLVDYAGNTVLVIIDRRSGKTRPAQIFVAMLDALPSPMPRQAGPRRSPTEFGAIPEPPRRSAASEPLCRHNTNVAVIKGVPLEGLANGVGLRDAGLQLELGIAQIGSISYGSAKFLGRVERRRRLSVEQKLAVLVSVVRVFSD